MSRSKRRVKTPPRQRKDAREFDEGKKPPPWERRKRHTQVRHADIRALERGESL